MSDPAMTCTATWLGDEIKRRFNVAVAYVVYTHGHTDHISGAQVFQKDGAVVVANQRALEPIIGEKIPTALRERVFDKDMKITLGGFDSMKTLNVLGMYRWVSNHRRGEW